jgi:tRNA(fMet)-specific endonuclease VapC
MLRYLLDTNICIDVIKARPRPMLESFNRHAGHMAISAITLSELLHGVEKSAAPEGNLAAVENFCSRLDVLPYGPKHPCTTARSAPPWNAGARRSA